MKNIPVTNVTIKLDNKAIQGFFDMLDENNISLDDAIADLSQAVDRQERKLMKNNKLEESTIILNCNSYKFRVDDGWLWIERGFYRHMVEYIENKKGVDLFDYFDSLEINYFGRFRIVNQEKRATIVDGKIARLIHEAKELTVLGNYDSYEIISENEKKS